MYRSIFLDQLNNIQIGGFLSFFLFRFNFIFCEQNFALKYLKYSFLIKMFLLWLYCTIFFERNVLINSMKRINKNGNDTIVFNIIIIVSIDLTAMQDGYKQIRGSFVFQLHTLMQLWYIIFDPLKSLVLCTEERILYKSSVCAEVVARIMF